MELKDIISITGKSGLFEVKAKAKNRVIASSLANGKKIPIMALNTISALNEISIYTLEGDIPLALVFKAMHDKKQEISIVDQNGAKDELKVYFKKIVPSYDQDRVYASNIKKIIHWFGILENNNFDFSKIETKKQEQTTKKDS